MQDTLRIENIVITTNVEVAINLHSLSNQWRELGVQMNLQRFPNLVWAIFKPKVTVLIFGSGKIVAEGCKVVSEGVYILRLVCGMLNDAGYEDARCGSMTIQNVVGNKFFPFPVNLYKLSESLGEFCSYGDTFPGARVRNMPQLEGTTAIIFWTGSDLITGGRSTRQVKRVSNRILGMINSSRFLEGETKESIIAKHQNLPIPKIITSKDTFE